MNRKNFFIFIFIACVVTFVTQGNMAFSATLLTFEGLQNNEQVQNFYNGGTGSMGSAGPDYGISFSDAARALIDSDAGGTGNFANEPTPDTVLYSGFSSSFIMNVQNGFSGQLSFYYSSTSPVTITIYSNLNGTGNILATSNLSPQGDQGCTGDPTGRYCNWTHITINFTGIAHSVVFSDGNGEFGFDNIQLGNQNNAISVPTLNLWGVWLLSCLIVMVGSYYLYYIKTNI